MDGPVGGMKLRELREYGIHTEESDVRAHVSVVNRTIYVFRTEFALAAFNSGQFREKDAFQPGFEQRTARGVLVPPDAIDDMRRLQFATWPYWDRVDKEMSTSRKGKAAMKCVTDAMQGAIFPFWVKATGSTSRDIEIRGIDIIVSMNTRVQVKCDYAGGDKPLGTGFLFLQKAEINPLGLH